MENLTVNENRIEAERLHQNILAHAQMAAESLWQCCKELKRMRDTKLYESLGFNKFSDYTEQALNLKERQAYNYISTYEKLGERFLQSNADLGITKLAELAQLPPMVRDEVVENNNLSSMSVSEIKKLVAENDQKGEQISLLQDESEQKSEEINSLQDEINKLHAQLKEAENKPTEVAVREQDKAELDKIRDKASEQTRKLMEKEFSKKKKELLEKADKEKAEALKKQKDATAAEIENYKTLLEAAAKDKKDAENRAEEFRKKAAISQSPETVKAGILLEEMMNSGKKLAECIVKLRETDPDSADKYAKAIRDRLISIAKQLGGGSDG